ncbi:glycosylphosphatidylinositol anchor biosynthesis [Mycoemilia scoparia]|uniref:Glycosylphosphatidylinositol anchor biosynthesis n=1 Tax=Mycoemilia scoparia TaxID=417184 RepID=A0A9W8A219_9FUNG|nr:glycosylphosphatidylinositol anchor biosynthesis [Mycoemilia scoparia]
MLGTRHQNQSRNADGDSDVDEFSAPLLIDNDPDSRIQHGSIRVCTSRFWFNYRHIANTLAIYRTVKRLGIPDSNIILMLADDMACNPRNKHPGAVFSHPNHEVDIYGDNVEVDYRGYEVTVENFIRLITGRVMPDTPRSKRLLTDDKSNILFYLTGHGGEDFLKFQDAEEINSYDIADAFSQMWEKKRYNEIMFMIDTCQANSMFSKFKSPNILSIGSSRVGESSYSYFHDADLGLTVIDRFTYVNLKYFEDIDMQSRSSFSDLYSTYDTKIIKSNPGYDTRHFKRRFDQTLLTDFLGAVAKAEITEKSYPLQRNITRDTSKTGSNTAKVRCGTASVGNAIMYILYHICLLALILLYLCATCFFFNNGV